MDFWLVSSKNDSNIICSSIKNESFLKIWRVWHIIKVCHALWYLKIKMGIAGSIFELHPPNFQKMCIFWRFTNDISTIFCYLLWFQFWKKCQSLPVHPRVVPDVVYGWSLFSKLTLLYHDGVFLSHERLIWRMYDNNFEIWQDLGTHQWKFLTGLLLKPYWSCVPSSQKL